MGGTKFEFLGNFLSYNGKKQLVFQFKRSNFNLNSQISI
jgi:hypothetical protein